MFFTGVWELPTAKNAGINFDAQPIPTLFGTPAATPTRTRSRSRTSRARTSSSAARRTASWPTSSPARWRWAEAGHIPAFQPVVQSPEYQALLPQAHYAPAAEILNYDPEAWFTGSGSDFQNYFLETVQGVYLDKSDAADGFNAFVRRVNVQLAKPNPV